MKNWGTLTDKTIHVATLVAVVVGLALVVYELRQSREMTYTQLIHESMSALSQERSAHYGEELGATLAKACYEPGQLSKAEGFVLDAYFSLQIGRVNRYKVQSEIGNFATPWKKLGEPQVLKVLSFPMGPNWLSNHPIWSTSAIDGEIAKYLKSFNKVEVQSCSTLIDVITNTKSDGTL